MNAEPEGRDVRRSRWRRLAVPAAVAAISALVAVVVVPVASMAAARQGAAPAAAPTTVFRDDFDGAAGSSVSGGNWLFDLGHNYPGGAGNWGTGEVENMTNSTANVFQDGQGNLHIRALRDGAGNWTSGRLETQRNDFQPAQGSMMSFESRLELPAVSGAGALGYWPAFWMLGGPFRGVFTNWPIVGEFDIGESVNAQPFNAGTFHCGFAPGGPCGEFTGNTSRFGCSCWGQFHTYTLQWDRSVVPETIRWLVDGTVYHSVNASQFDAGTWNNATRHGYMIMLDLAMGGAFPAALGGGPTGATVSGGAMVLDYVSVTSTAPGGPTPTPTVTGHPTPTPSGHPTPTPTPTGGGVGARSTIQAEGAIARSGTRTEPTSDAGGGLDVHAIGDGGWLQFNHVDFGSSPLTQFQGRAASGAAGGVSGLVEVHLDSLSSPAAGSFAIANTGGWQSWRTVPANMTGTTGVHTVFLKFVSGSGQDFVNLNWFTFAP